MILRIKIKHLAVLIAALGLLAVLAATVVLPRLEVARVDRLWASGSAGEAELLATIDEAPSPERRWSLIREHLLGVVAAPLAHRFDVYAGPSMTMVSGEPRQPRPAVSTAAAAPYLAQYVEQGPIDLDYRDAALRLAEYEAGEDRADAALAMLEGAEQRLAQAKSRTYAIAPIRAALALERARLLGELGRTDEAEAIIQAELAQAAPDEWDIRARAVRVRTRLLMQQGSPIEALDDVREQRAAYEAWWKTRKPEAWMASGTEPYELEELQKLESRLAAATADGAYAPARVGGTLTYSDGTPVAHAGIFLRARQDIAHSILESEPYQTVTDGQGRFAFPAVTPGDYQLHLGLTFAQIDGWTYPYRTDEWISLTSGEVLTQEVQLRPLLELRAPVDETVLRGDEVRFAWEPVDGAAYYTVNVNLTGYDSPSTFAVLIDDHVAETELTVPLERLYHAPQAILFGDEEGTVDPVSIIGMADPGARYSWYVEAYDGEHRMLTRSKGYRLAPEHVGALPFFYLRARELTAADRLMLDGQMEEALTAYREAYARDPQDTYSLGRIIRILEARSRMQQEDRDEARYMEEAMPYVRDILQLMPESEYAYKLLDHAFEMQDWETYNEVYARYYERAEDDGAAVSSYTLARHGIALMRQGRLDEAGESLNRAMERDPSHRFIGDYIAVQLLRGGSLEEALELARRYPDRSNGAPERDWSLLLGELQQALAVETAGPNASRSPGSSARAAQLQAELEAYQADEETAKKRVAAIADNALRAFMEALIDAG
ncbi:hypothetical protein IDH44_01555 [Paenibacillus sp. IB182496]|uniref:Tetratricopeptide repeat protein n=1 Tax=Paenibacillus sabuli TaxID=2772509 RepID=A0A927BQU3_9BACL|nr:carboxypeptidase-like regulatory domain-containing protein [Paenibacillus sabuli]MBD2843864.1 hypothetical protein [Paenibacillus sabuli]